MQQCSYETFILQAPPIPPPKRFNKAKDASTISSEEAKKRKEEEDAAVAALNEAVEAAEASQKSHDSGFDKDPDYKDPIDLLEDEDEEEPYYDSVPLDDTGGEFYSLCIHKGEYKPRLYFYLFFMSKIA